MSSLRYLGPLWYLVQLPGLWALLWSPEEGVESEIWGRVLRSVGFWWAMSYLGFLDPAWPLVESKTS